MKTPDKMTTETMKRPHSQLMEQLMRNANPLKPHMAGSKKRQQGDRKQAKSAHPDHNPDMIRKIIGRA